MGDAILRTSPLGFPWATSDPFLFCVHHDDAYPAGNERLGPAVSLAGRNLGNDFEVRDGFRMYHGQVVPGFPGHPHRGFETVTIVRRGFIDHSDSLGATARFGNGDVQWLTAGRGVVHSEMFPLLQRDQPNPLELFQIWLNLPSKSKMVAPYFSMFWKEARSTAVTRDAEGRATAIDVVAGGLRDVRAAAPPPDSWAADPSNEVAIWTIQMEPGATTTLPPASPGVNRSLYVFRGTSLSVDDTQIARSTRVELRPEREVRLVNGDQPAEALLLQGRPIAEPVAQHGPFVMTNRAELQQAFEDYQRTAFGGWPWPSESPVHDRSEGRFARYPDGRVEVAADLHK
jgi:redox-sensitive bicupin YhaK (pirin superfamily)